MRWMAVVAAGAALVGAQGAVGQSAYAGVGLGQRAVSGFTGTHTPELSGLLGWRAGPHGVELSVSHLEETQTQPDWTPSLGEAPIVLGVSAVTVGAGYAVHVPVGAFPVRPVFRVGGEWVRLTDTSESDTPAVTVDRWLWGGYAAAGARVTVIGGVWASLGAGYRLHAEPEDRPALALDLDGWSFEAAVGIGW